MEHDCIWCRIYKRERDEARSLLFQSYTGDEVALNKRLREEVRRMQIQAERRNFQLDAMHWVWCDGGCATGVHRFDGAGPEAVTQEIVDTAVRNTERLKSWLAARQSRVKQGWD